VRVLARGGKRALASYRVLRRIGARALVELELQSGRTHQLRVQLASRASPICGDELYGGEPAPRLMLHALALEAEFAERSFQAPVPEVFRDWLEHQTIAFPDAAELARRLDDACTLRWGLRGASEALRLVDGDADGLPGVVVEAFGDFAVLTVSHDAAYSARALIAAQLCERGARGVYLKVRLVPGAERRPDEITAPALPIAGEPAPEVLVVRERGVPFGVRLGEGLSVGLFLDQRDARRTVRDLAAGARVLNLFSYTCSFSLAAALGGARETLSVDLSSRALRWGRDNFERAGVSLEGQRFIEEDASRWLGRAERRGERFELIVLDPPTFARRGRKVLRMPRDYGPLAVSALRLLAPGGRLLAVMNHRKTHVAELRRLLRRAAEEAHRDVDRLVTLRMPDDFRDRPEGEVPTKSVLARVL